METFKLGEIVRIKKEYQDTIDDGKYIVYENNGDRLFIQTIDEKILKTLSIVPIELVKSYMIEKIK